VIELASVSLFHQLYYIKLYTHVINNSLLSCSHYMTHMLSVLNVTSLISFDSACLFHYACMNCVFDFHDTSYDHSDYGYANETSPAIYKLDILHTV
jgi:hypothetical protein